jgi:K+-transporting ATPase ATPase C chain
MTMMRPALTLLLLFTLLTGVLYPGLVTLFGQTLFPDRANGSLVEANGRVVGSRLIAQRFSEPKYFWPRPSAADYNAMASSGSNLGPTNPKLQEAIGARAQQFASPAPIDLLTASGSGLDPHISPEAALHQVDRVAEARSVSPERVRALVEAHVEDRTLGLLGEPRVNVLLLNMDMDRATIER